LSKSLKNAERFMGVHFFNPAYKMKLVEVVPTRFTSRQALQTVLSFLQHLGKIPIIVKDSPGFLVNRMLMPYLNEAIFMLEEGFLPDEIDSSMLGFGMPLGPFKLLKEIGPQVAYKASKILEDSFGDRMKVPKSLEKDFSRHLSRFLKKKLNSRQGSSEYIRNRLLEPIRREAGLCLKEGVVDNPEIVDLALLTGIGFPSSKRIWEF
jgi:3-hydroxyacyl-CoA dehydrogenase/enoyl-CoA hydratase/3-hydroxybutyryl-CoA epimerase